MQVSCDLKSTLNGALSLKKMGSLNTLKYEQGPLRKILDPEKDV